jgi:hypothetical protein
VATRRAPGSVRLSIHPHLTLAGLAFTCWYSNNRRVESAVTVAFASPFLAEQFLVNGNG